VLITRPEPVRWGGKELWGQGLRCRNDKTTNFQLVLGKKRKYFASCVQLGYWDSRIGVRREETGV